MTRIKLTLWGLIVGLTGLWLFIDPSWTAPYEFYAARNALVNYTGIIGIAAMSVAMLLALKPVFAETWFDGLDKMYRLHKWLGITGLVFSVAHWLAAKAPKWAVEWGLMERRVRGPRPEIADPVQLFFQQQRGIAEGLGEWAFYAAVVLIVLALVKWFPYRLFHKTHIWLSAVYLVLAYHALILMKFSYWGTALGPIMAALLIAGSVAAVLVVLKSFGVAQLTNTTTGIVQSIAHHTDNHVLQVGVTLSGRWPGHDAGQFAFLTFDRREGAHPFTIASSWQNDGQLMFLIKELGDYTRALPKALKVGDGVEIEGPFGRFDFHTTKPRQIWVAGGIGISPFVARMRELTSQPAGKPIDLFYATADANQDYMRLLQRRADDAGVRLHIKQSPRDGFLSAADIMSAVPDWQTSDIWFCGPAAFGDVLKRNFEHAGLPSSAFHQEYFEIR